MEDTENKAPAAVDGGTDGAGKKPGRHRHHHRGNRGGHPQENSGNARPQEGNANGEQPSRNGQPGAPKQNGERKPNNENNNRSNGDRNRRNRNRNNRRPYEKGIADPYGTPSGETAQSLADLRAQIVLKAADGSVPAPAPHAEEIPAASVEAAPEALPVSAGEEVPEVELFPDPAPEDTSPKVEVIGVRFRSSGKTYYFAPRDLKAQIGDFVIVETARGAEFGEVTLGNRMIPEKNAVLPLRPVIRIATDADKARNAENRDKEQKALVICREKIAAHELEMKLIDAQYAFDNSKLLFYFSSDGRVDFRELVKDLASVFHTRIELRQIGIRDEAKMLGGLGACGRPLCCSAFLTDFAQVSIKMAKEQNLSLNSTKISGVCGRLMCCLHYEADTYTEEIRKTPSNDSLVKTEDGVGVVISSNPLAGTVRVVLKDAQDPTPKQYHRDAVTVIGKEKRGANREKDAGNKEKSDTEG